MPRPGAVTVYFRGLLLFTFIHRRPRRRIYLKRILCKQSYVCDYCPRPPSSWYWLFPQQQPTKWETEKKLKEPPSDAWYHHKYCLLAVAAVVVVVRSGRTMRTRSLTIHVTSLFPCKQASKQRKLFPCSQQRRRRRGRPRESEIRSLRRNLLQKKLFRVEYRAHDDDDNNNLRREDPFHLFFQIY